MSEPDLIPDADLVELRGPDPADAAIDGRIAVTETKTREPQFAFPDDEPADNLPEPLRLTPEQYAEAKAREEQYRREWAEINQALTDNSMAVTRAMSRWYPRAGERERQTERVMTRFEDGSFLLNRLGAEGVIDQDLAVVLLHFRRGLIEEYGAGPAAVMLIDRAVAAYHNGATGGAHPLQTISVNRQCGSSIWTGRRSIIIKITPTADHAFSVEQFHARIGSNNATRLSGKQWLCSATRA